MKYLLSFLERLEDGPDLTDPGFQQLLVDVQAGKTQAKSADAFYESLEKIVNELKSTPESVPFQKPVSKREAPDYYDVVQHPMDLSTILRNVKGHKYKNKADFAADLDLIWENCYHYNTNETHPIRASARFMKQKADHHLEFLVDKNDRGTNSLLPLLSAASESPLLHRAFAASSSHLPFQGSFHLRPSDEDAAGESDDAAGEVIDQLLPDHSFRHQSSRFNGEASPQYLQVGHEEGEASRGISPTYRNRSASRARRDTSIASCIRSASHTNGLRGSPPPCRPKLQTDFDSTPALIRTPNTIDQYLPFALDIPGPSYSDKGKAKEILCGVAPPAWYPTDVTAESDETRVKGGWWGMAGCDEAYVGGLPVAPVMAPSVAVRRKCIPSKHSPLHKGDPVNSDRLSPRTPPLVASRPIRLESLIERSVDKLSEIRRVINQTQEFQRIEAEGGVLPAIDYGGRERKKAKVERRSRKRAIKVENGEVMKRRRSGGEVGEKDAVLSMKKATACMLAQAGFEGANEVALDLFTRMATNQIRNMGRTFRLLSDGFAHKMDADEIILHALHENGRVQLSDLETHLRDDIEKEGAKISDMARKVRQAYREVTTAPVIGDDMLLADSGEMLLDGNFADQLGEDFLGLRDMGIEKEFGLSSLTIPSSVFYGRRRRGHDVSSFGPKDVELEYPPPPPFISLSIPTLHSHVPALLHAFYAARLESGLGVQEDDGFDHVHSQIGSLGQIVVKNQPGAAQKRRKEVSGDTEPREGKKEAKRTKKISAPGPGKGNWIRPPKEERQRRAAEKRAARERMRALANGNVISPPSDDVGEEEDAEGEEE